LAEEELANVPFLVLGNKIDLGTAPSEEDLKYQLGLHETYGKEAKREKNPSIRPIELYMCSVVRKMGYGDGKCASIFTARLCWLIKGLRRRIQVVGPIFVSCL
jgi:hypothetical protein